MREWLRSLRVGKGYTQQAMADKLGVSVQLYNFIENGKRQDTLNLQTASKISDIFRISLKRIREYEEALKEKTKSEES